MNNDGLVWEVLNNQFCSYKVKTDHGALCRNPYNITGLCNRRDCPLANSKYATVRERRGRIFLCIKTPERAHTPAKQWEWIPLPKNFAQAVDVIDKELQYWPNWMVHMSKQRLVRITQYLIRMRKLKLKNKHTLVPIKKKLERREKSREVRAEAAARLDQSIEKELLERLRNKAYGDQPLNVNEAVWKEIIDGDELEAESDVTTEDELEEEYELEDGENDEEIEQEESSGSDGIADEFVEGNSESEEEEYSSTSAEESDSSNESDSDQDTYSPKNGKKRSQSAHSNSSPNKKTSRKKIKRRGPHIEVEYETESQAQDDMLTNW